MDVNEIDLEGLDLAELRALLKRVEKQIADFSARKRQEALEAARAAASERGFDLQDLMGQKGRGKRKPAREDLPEARYANPDDPSQTWSGRGRRPAWMTAALEGGASLESLAIT